MYELTTNDFNELRFYCHQQTLLYWYGKELSQIWKNGITFFYSKCSGKEWQKLEADFFTHLMNNKHF